jgi:hypothetical protein
MAHVLTCINSDSKYHSYSCACGYSSGTERHIVVCSDDKNVCIECGEEGVNGVTDHYENIGVAEMDEYYHWYDCGSCGTVVDASKHIFDCSYPGVCVECGMVTEYGNLQHFESDEWNSDANGHWKLCMQCGEKTVNTTHSDVKPIDGFCDSCKHEVAKIGPHSTSSSLNILFSSVEDCSFENLYVYNPDGSAPGQIRVTSSNASVVTAERVVEYATAARWRIQATGTGAATLTLTSPNGLTKEIPVTVSAADGVMELPAGTKRIEAEAFKGVSAEVICIPDGTESIGDGAFAGNSGLKALYIPDSVESLGDGVFRGCNNLRIYVRNDSDAYRYAIDNGVSVVIIF